MEISDGLLNVMVRIGGCGNIPVIAVETDHKDQKKLEAIGFRDTGTDANILAASLSTKEIRMVANMFKKGKLRHNRPMPRKHHTASI